jgi:transcriptional regulator with XRE-family HTH domain
VVSKPTPLARRIKKFREDAGLTQVQLAHEMDVSPPSVNNWESGITAPTVDKIPRLAKVLGKTTDELLGVRS